jgi:hypothetical protein
VEDIKSLHMVFDSFTFHHVYRERNEEVDRASKEGSHMDLGHWKISEFLNDHFQEQQKPSCEHWTLFGMDNYMQQNILQIL